MFNAISNCSLNDKKDVFYTEITDNQMSGDHVGMEAIGQKIDRSQPKQENDQQELEFYHQKAYNFMRTLKRDYKRLAIIYNACLKEEQERERRNKQEILEMKKTYHQMESEKINIKRKKWCRYCESEATYISTEGYKFFCSKECEQKELEFVNTIESSFKT